MMYFIEFSCYGCNEFLLMMRLIDVNVHTIGGDYNVKVETLQVRNHKVNVNQTPSKMKSALAISYSGLDLPFVVKDFSYVGFSTRVPKSTHGAYSLYDWKFNTTCRRVVCSLS